MQVLYLLIVVIVTGVHGSHFIVDLIELLPGLLIHQRCLRGRGLGELSTTPLA